MLDLVDIGANLTHDSFASDRDAIMQRAEAAGVRRMIVTGTTVAASEHALQLAAEFPGRLFATAGVHPHHASDFDAETAAALRVLADNAAVVAVGECGLDFCRDYSPHTSQLQAFEAQLQLAAAVGKPVFLHQRDAHEPFVDLLRKYRPQLVGGVAHCFTGGREELETYLELDLYVGITGWICDERRGHDLRTAVRSLPLERVLVETDAPYLLPRDLEHKPAGRRNEPSILPHIVAVLARHMEREGQAVASAATANTEALFGLSESVL